MAGTLLRCTTLWGTCDRIEGLPAIRHASEVTYIPYSEDGPWGLFADGRRISPDGRDAAGPLPPAERAETGPVLYIGRLALHYGHFLCNTLPALWPLHGWHGPRPKLLCQGFGSSQALRDYWATHDFLVAILGRLGLSVDDLVSFDRPVHLPAVSVPEPALREQAATYAVFGDLCRGIGRAFWRDDEVDSIARPVYLAKTRLGAGIAHITNEAAIVEALARRGVEIAFPETLPFSQQVGLLSTRRIVMGSAGSAFHTTAFAAPGRRVVGLNWQPALNANFALIDALAGTRARYYHPRKTRYLEGGDWQVRWEVADPGGVAAALLIRAEWLDRGEPDGEGPVPALRRLSRRVRGLVGRGADGASD